MTADGVEGDRRFAIFDLDTGLGLTARRVPQLLFASAALMADGHVRITLPDGSIADTDATRSDWLGRRVALRSADNNAGSRYENVVDFEHEQNKRLGNVRRSVRAVPRLRLGASVAPLRLHHRRMAPPPLPPQRAAQRRTRGLPNRLHRCHRRCDPHNRPHDPAMRDGHTPAARRDRLRPGPPAHARTRARRPPRGRGARHPPRHHPHRRRSDPSVDGIAPASRRHTGRDTRSTPRRAPHPHRQHSPEMHGNERRGWHRDRTASIVGSAVDLPPDTIELIARRV